MFTTIIRSFLIISNLVSFSLGVLSIGCLLILPGDEQYPGNWTWLHLLLYNLLFVVIAVVGIAGACLLKTYLLLVHAIVMLTLILTNFAMWLIYPEKALMDSPQEVVIVTSMFDVFSTIFSFVLVLALYCKSSHVAAVNIDTPKTEISTINVETP